MIYSLSSSNQKLLPWQAGIVDFLLHSRSFTCDRVRYLNFGRGVGHSALAEHLCNRNDIKCKLYITSIYKTYHYSVASDRIGLITDTHFSVSPKDNTFNVISIDLASMPIYKYKASIDSLVSGTKNSIQILVLQGEN